MDCVVWLRREEKHQADVRRYLLSLQCSIQGRISSFSLNVASVSFLATAASKTGGPDYTFLLLVLFLSFALVPFFFLLKKREKKNQNQELSNMNMFSLAICVHTENLNGNSLIARRIYCFPLFVLIRADV